MERETIKLFMWGYQRHFQISLKVRAETLFNALDPGFVVEVFLLGLVRNESPTNHPVCLEPEECGFEPHHFSSVREDAKHFLAVDPDRNLMATHPAHQNSIEKRRMRRSERSAVIKAISDRIHQTNDQFFFSGFMPVADYDVGVILRLSHRYDISHCVVIVVSEDGTAEWIPELLPRISRKLLREKEVEADAILAKKEFPYGNATGLLTWFSEHRFYLSQSVSEKANRIERARKKMFEEGKINFRFGYAHFEPNQNMSEDYLEE